MERGLPDVGQVSHGGIYAFRWRAHVCRDASFGLAVAQCAAVATDEAVTRGSDSASMGTEKVAPSKFLNCDWTTIAEEQSNLPELLF